MRVSVNDGLLFELELAGVSAAALDAHSAIVITVNLSQYDIVYRSGDLAPLKCFAIIELQGEDTHGIKLYGTSPKLAFEI